jgi:hypothetical protein
VPGECPVKYGIARLAQSNFINLGDTRNRSSRSVERGSKLADDRASVCPNAANDAVHALSTRAAREHFAAPSVDSPAIMCSRKVELPVPVEEREWSKSRTD